MGNPFSKYYLNIIVSVISLLLIGDIIVTYYNNNIIKENRELQREAEDIKLYAEQIGKSTIHGLDIGLRGYVIMQTPQFFSPVDSAILRKDSILANVERRLLRQNYDLTEFYALRDSLNSYIRFNLQLKSLLDHNQKELFYEQFSSDKGLELWLQYLQFIKNISTYENQINAQAHQRYEAALRNNYIIQIVLFLICFPTLLYTVYYTKRTFKYAALAHRSEADKNKLLMEQNTMLELKVEVRTKEIASQNKELIQQQEEIASQRDALSTQNKKLSEAQATIELQNKSIQSENVRLEDIVKARTRQLRQTNLELIEHNHQLEQFAFLAAHNLRAPLARILGLANILSLSTEDREQIIDAIVNCTHDLEWVVKDLNTVLELKRHTGILTRIPVRDVIGKVSNMLEKELADCHANLTINTDKAQDILAIPSYTESIFLHLITNAVKFRHPDRAPVIRIATDLDPQYVRVSVSDNGLGIDLDAFRGKLFQLYKRFHPHIEGKGLGLYLVKAQIESMGGKIEVVSTPAQGTTFTVDFKR